MQPITLGFHGTYGATLSDMREALQAIRDSVDDTITLQILDDKFKAYGGLRGMIWTLDNKIDKIKY